MKITEVIERENWRLTRVETDEYIFYIEETVLVQASDKVPVTGERGWVSLWAKTGIYAAVRPEGLERVLAVQGAAAIRVAKEVQAALHPCESCGGKPEYLKCPKCGREP